MCVKGWRTHDLLQSQKQLNQYNSTVLWNLFFHKPCKYTPQNKCARTHTHTQIVCFTHVGNTNTLPNARGQMDGKGELGSFVHSEFRSWPLNKLALQRWAALTMMYGRNTIHCCYELAGSGEDSACAHPCTDMQKHTHAQTHRHKIKKQ